MTEAPIIIIGTGQGGFQAAASLRQDGYEGPITMIGDEPGLPYQRPPLSKDYMKTGEAGRLALRPVSFFERSDITLIEGRAVVRIDRDRNVVVDDTGVTHPYAHLILATGTHNFVPPVENIDLPGVYGLRTLADAERLRAELGTMQHAIVIGGGFIGLEFAAVARAAGIEVTLIEMADRLMARAVSPEISAHFRKAHEAHGVTLHFGAQVSAVIAGPDGRAAGVQLADGTSLEGDCVLIAAGVRPNVELASEAGLEVANGVVVDAFLLTSDPDISALGDCASFPDPFGPGHIRLESVQAATDHARAISKRLTGGSVTPYAHVPWFWSNQGDLKLQIAGFARECDASVLRDGGDGKLTVYRFGKGLLQAVETVNSAADHMAARKLLALDPPVQRHELDACGYDMKALVKSRSEPVA